jgi:hypothetical protein
MFAALSVTLTELQGVFNPEGGKENNFVSFAAARL